MSSRYFASSFGLKDDIFISILIIPSSGHVLRPTLLQSATKPFFSRITNTSQNGNLGARAYIPLAGGLYSDPPSP